MLLNTTERPKCAKESSESFLSEVFRPKIIWSTEAEVIHW